MENLQVPGELGMLGSVSALVAGGQRPRSLLGHAQ